MSKKKSITTCNNTIYAKINFKEETMKIDEEKLGNKRKDYLSWDEFSRV